MTGALDMLLDKLEILITHFGELNMEDEVMHLLVGLCTELKVITHAIGKVRL